MRVVDFLHGNSVWLNPPPCLKQLFQYIETMKTSKVLTVPSEHVEMVDVATILQFTWPGLVINDYVTTFFLVFCSF